MSEWIKPDREPTQSAFCDAIIQHDETADGRRYIHMTLRGGLMHVHCGINQAFNLRQARTIANELGIPLYITDEVKRELGDEG